MTFVDPLLERGENEEHSPKEGEGMYDTAQFE